MISNQVLQNTLEGLKEISRIEFCIIDTEGKVLASTFSDSENKLYTIMYLLFGNRSDTIGVTITK